MLNPGPFIDAKPNVLIIVPVHFINFIFYHNGVTSNPLAIKITNTIGLERRVNMNHSGVIWTNFTAQHKGFNHLLLFFTLSLCKCLLYFAILLIN